MEEYVPVETPKNYVKQQEWDRAIGLQEFDNLNYLNIWKKLLQENVIGEKTIYEVEHNVI
mgnify:CR=1 FL=1